MSKLFSNVAAVVLAAGRGSRLNCGEIPKVMCEIGGKPMISYTVETLKKLGLTSEHICLVVGYQKHKVEEFFGNEVLFAHQQELLGTAHAAYTGMQKLSGNISHVLVLGGDDSAFYSAKTLSDFIQKHIQNDMKLSLLTAEIEDPSQLGRVIRKENGEIEIIEKEYLTAEQEHIKEISTGTFVFDRKWFMDIFPNMPKMRKLGEFGLPTALAMARKMGLAHQVVKLENSREWCGVNTPEQLKFANERKKEE